MIRVVITQCKGAVTHITPYVYDQSVKLCNLEMRSDARINSHFTRILPLSLHSNPKHLKPFSSLALLLWLFDNRESLWHTVFSISGSPPVGPSKCGISRISPLAGHTAEGWVGDGFGAVLACRQRTRVWEAAAVGVSSLANGAGGRGLSSGFEEQLQGSKVEWSQGLEFYIYKSCK